MTEELNEPVIEQAVEETLPDYGPHDHIAAACSSLSAVAEADDVIMGQEGEMIRNIRKYAYRVIYYQIKYIHDNLIWLSEEDLNDNLDAE